MKSVTRCTWTEDSDGCWRTDCGNFAEVNEGLPSANGMKYCWYCGKRLVEFPHKEEEKMIQTYDLTLDGRLLSNKKGDGLLVYTADHLAALAEKDREHAKDITALIKQLQIAGKQIATLKGELKSLTEAYNGTAQADIIAEQKELNNALAVRWGKAVREIATLTAGEESLEIMQLREDAEHYKRQWGGREEQIVTLKEEIDRLKRQVVVGNFNPHGRMVCRDGEAD